ncbi:MAG: hypothetical protein JNL53_16500 [Cyclobacteriaceae bacterium]|nr:hypothetical protein [Cyclobacteriaceae bacterium]
MENPFTTKMQLKNDGELLKILKSSTSFDYKAVLAAFYELEKRGLPLTEFVSLKLELEEKFLRENTNMSNTETSSYSKVIIFASSFLLLPIIGAVLLSLNLFDRSKKMGILVVLLFGILYTLLSLLVLNLFTYPFWLVLLLNGFGGGMLSEFFWNKFMRDNK